MTEQWWADNCPQCFAKNWINNGDPEDFTAMDVEGIRCWKCDHCWKLGEDQDTEYEPYYQRGRHFEEQL